MPLQRTVPEDTSETTRQVNSILRNLRGEHFRHSRNVQRAPARLPAPLHAHNLPTLPISLIHPSAEDSRRRAGPAGHHSTRPIWIAGPNPPHSWTSPSSPKIDEADSADINSPAWREHALDLVFSPDDVSMRPPGSVSLRSLRKGEFPTLALLSLHAIRAECSAYELAEIMPYIPPHLRRVLVRHSAINRPLSQAELNAICGEEGHADGELVVVGPHATLRSDHFRRIHSSRESIPDEHAAEESTWDSLATQGEPSVLFSLTLLSTPLTFNLSDLPPTITCLALINIPKPVSLQRLPSHCPLVSLLDLSYNSWLIPASGEKLLEDYPWTKLHYLKVLGLRGCHVTSTLLSQVNRGRWDDVDVVH
ncbi:hypothetical protein DFH29DRAFT_994681 [Suillus ampliporus]|nr:hypothetical protein DFH29DRAFT_994681 [Suillus ampliporus]